MPTMSTHTETGLPIITYAAVIKAMSERLASLLPSGDINDSSTPQRILESVDSHNRYINRFYENAKSRNPALVEFIWQSSLAPGVDRFLILSIVAGVLRLLEIQETLYQKE